MSFNEDEMPFKKELPADKVIATDLQSFGVGEGFGRMDSDEDDEVTEIGKEGGAHPQSPQGSTQQHTEESQMPRRNPAKNTRLPSRFSDYDMSFFSLCVAEVFIYTDASTYEEALRSKESQRWIKVMREEIESLLRNGTWILCGESRSSKIG